MEIQSKNAIKLMKQINKHYPHDKIISYEQMSRLKHFSDITISELIAYQFLKIDYAHNFFIEDKIRYYPKLLRQHYKILYMTSFWFPLVVALITSIVTTLITLYLNNP